MPRRSLIIVIGLSMLAVSCRSNAPTSATPSPEREIDRVLKATLAPPTIHTEPGFTATTLVPPGDLYDPLTMVVHGDVVWVNDDGGTGRHGRIWAVDKRGHVSVVIDADRLLPSTGFDVAPPGFGAYAGRIVTLSQAEFYLPGVRRNHIIQVFDPSSRMKGTTLCELPTHGTINGGVAGAGLEARFGPPGTPFANRLFSVTILNNTVYQTTADGSCTPFVTFDRQVWGIAFPADGSRMLATLKGGGPMSLTGEERSEGSDADHGSIVSVRPDGTVDPTPVLDTARRPTDVEVAPAGFGPYAGQIFYTDWETDSPSPLDLPLKGESTLSRITPDGRSHLVASGFLRPAGIAFVDGAIWISNINRDRVDMPEGSIIKIDVKP